MELQPKSTNCPTCGKPSNDVESSAAPEEETLITNLPKEVLSMIGGYLPLKDLKNFGLGCKAFRQSTLHHINKRSRMKLIFPFSNSFLPRITKFCKYIRPLILPKTSSLQLCANVFRYKVKSIPNIWVMEHFQGIAEKIIYVAERNESYTVKDVFGMFVDVHLKVGIGGEWQIPCFVQLWNLVASSNVERMQIELYFGDKMAHLMTGDHISQLNCLNNVKQLTLFSYLPVDSREKSKNMKTTVFNALFSKFPNLQFVEIFPSYAVESFVKAVDHTGKKMWKISVWGSLTIASKNK